MTQPSTPSAGALRAAATIVADVKVGWYRTFGGEHPSKVDSHDTDLVKRLAPIIDRETGMAELLKAAKIGLKYIESEYGKPRDGDIDESDQSGAERDYKQIEKAIRDVEAELNR
ncbi:hypothetical protein LCGC14_3122130 [marine sediment metagenome]|uniref:Uncharacterized protein n=1 Tax=marine sediment metagenome TaxID=412755 RepID=A0A0F8W282_9ZZZZ